MKDKNNIALMLSHKPGIEIAQYFSSLQNESISAVYFEKKSPYSETILKDIEISEDRVFYGRAILNDPNHHVWLKSEKISFLITVYWPWLIGQSYLSCVQDSVNFHPALLPVNRGWYPHVHSIIDGSVAGVTLHKIAEGADEGDIWVQKEVSINKFQTAEQVYLALQKDIVDLFKDSWKDISSGKIKAVPQNAENAIYHSKDEIEKLDRVDLENLSSIEFFNLLRARSFGNTGFAYIEVGGKRYYLNLRISSEKTFD